MATKKSTPTMKASRPAPFGKVAAGFSLCRFTHGLCVRMRADGWRNMAVSLVLVDESVDRQKRKSEVCGCFSV